MKIKEIFVNALGVFLTPILLAIFLADRIFLACFPWIQIQKVQDWAKDHQRMAYSMIRITFVALITSLLIIWL